MSERILMIEDDRQLSAMLSEYLQPLGLRVTAAASAAEGLRLIERDTFDALVLDVMLPDRDGFEVCRVVRAHSDIPILMLTARGDELDRIVGLELGADDYLASRSIRGSCLRGCARSCAGANFRPRRARRYCASDASRSIAMRGRSDSTVSRAHSRVRSLTSCARSRPTMVA
jgi:CheY-like chemotaxis protein